MPKQAERRSTICCGPRAFFAGYSQGLQSRRGLGYQTRLDISALLGLQVQRFLDNMYEPVYSCRGAMLGVYPVATAVTYRYPFTNTRALKVKCVSRVDALKWYATLARPS